MQVEVDFSKLRRSVNKLRHSSRSLDHEKVNAEQELHKLMVEWAKLKQREGWLSKKFRKLIDWFRDRFGWYRDEEENRLAVEGLPRFGANGLMRPRIGRPPAWAQEQQAKAEEGENQVREDDVDNAKHKNKKHKHKKWQWGQRRKLLKRLRKAAERVRRANAKLILFEQGLTSGDGLKGREWYKHLGVAPGKLQGGRVHVKWRNLETDWLFRRIPCNALPRTY
jgi:N-acetylated-alpha-linked acidic dipeptidase